MTDAQLALLLATLWAVSIRSKHNDTVIRIFLTAVWTLIYFLETHSS